MIESGFPTGAPPESTAKLHAWWAEEMKSANCSGMPSVQYAPYVVDSPGTPSGFKKLVNTAGALQFMGRTEVGEKHSYRASIPGAPWPIQADVVTGEQGWITEITYRVRLNARVQGEVSLTKRIGWLGEKVELTGSGAATLRDAKILIKACKSNLSRRYQPPLRGFHAKSKMFELDAASLDLRESGGGTEAIVRLTVKDKAAFVGRTYSLGLRDVIDLLRTVEAAAA